MRQGPLLLLLVLGATACRPGDPAAARQTPGARPPSPAPAQQLTLATISDPKTFNPILAVDASSGSATEPLFEGLLRLNPKTLVREPVLAQRWELSPDGTVCVFFLRRDVRWHDGQPFTAADVTFTFEAIFDARVPNSIKHTLTVDGQPVRVTARDDYTVEVRVPHPFAPLLDAIGVPILPRHVLGASLAAGTFQEQWGIETSPEALVGTGPYRMARYVPAQFIEYRRNPAYWRMDDAGRRLPYLDGETVLIVPDQEATYLKFVAGQTDIHSPRPEEIGELRSRADQLRVTVEEIGLDTGSTFVAFNRNPRAYTRDGATEPRLGWFTDLRFLRALAHAVDKQAMIVNTLNGYGKPAVAEISPENTLFHNPNLQDYAYDLAAARRLLQDAGFADRDGDGVLEDPQGHAVAFTLTTNAGNRVREKMCAILAEDWAKLGLKVSYRPLEFQALVEKLNSTYEWDAILIGFTGTLEPNNGANLLRSSGNLHFWNPNQRTPATPWEAEIDALLEQGARELDTAKRRPIYWRIQEILHEQLPMIETVRPVTFVAYARALQNYRPTVWGVDRPELIRFAE